METKELNIFTDVRNDYEDENIGDAPGKSQIARLIYIDAWRSDEDDDDGEEGMVAAKVFRTASGDRGAVYATTLASHDAKVRASVKQALCRLCDEYDNGKCDAIVGDMPGTECRHPA